jgi:hypothetical protein
MENYSGLVKKEVLLFAATCMNKEDVGLNEVFQACKTNPMSLKSSSCCHKPMNP